MDQDSDTEAKRSDLNSAYDLIRGFFASIVDVHERAMLVRNLELLHETAWQSVAPSAKEKASSRQETESGDAYNAGAGTGPDAP